MHREAQSFFVKQLETTAEGKAARAYLEVRGLNAKAIARFGIGYAPHSGDALLRYLKQKYAEMVEWGWFRGPAQSGRLLDRFRRRITFAIANESEPGGIRLRALGDKPAEISELAETPIYSKSDVLYYMDRAKDAIRRRVFAVLVEGYMDAIAVAARESTTLWQVAPASPSRKSNCWAGSRGA